MSLTHTGTPVLETERLILRRYTTDDAQAMYDHWASKDEVTHYLTWPTHSSAEISRMVLESWTEGYADPKTYHWGLQLKATGELIGDLAVVHMKEPVLTAELGWCMDNTRWGQGLMPEAARAVLAYLFDTVGFNRVEAGHDVNNPKSGRVMQKIGMTMEGVHRQAGLNNQGICDVAIYAILRQEWLAGK